MSCPVERGSHVAVGVAGTGRVAVVSRHWFCQR